MVAPNLPNQPPAKASPNKRKPARTSGGRNGNGSTGTRSAPKTASEVTPDLVQMAIRSRFSPIRGLTPQLLSVQLDQFYLGFLAWTALTWDAIERRDDVIKGVASKRKKAVARLEWEIMTTEDTPEAKLHQEALQDFYDNLSAVNAIDENERGGMSLLVRQMMDAVGKKYAVHEIVWRPGEKLTAEFRFTPLWFFENRTGKLRFLRMLGGADGEPLEPGGWMVTTGDGIMEACSVAYMFKALPLKDWLSYSDKYGMPGILGKTAAAKGSDAGNAMRDAVNSFAQNWSGTIYGDDGVIKDPISLIEARGEGTLPFPPLIERMDRAISALWRGSDLSTMSRGGSASSTGASVQGDESDILLFDDAEIISESLNLQVDRWIVWQLFGVDRSLAYIRLMVPDKKNVESDLKVDELLLKAGARLGERERMEYYGRPAPEADDTALHSPATVTERITPGGAGGQPGATGGGSVGAVNPLTSTLSNEQFGNSLGWGTPLERDDRGRYSDLRSQVQIGDFVRGYHYVDRHNEDEFGKAVKVLKNRIHIERPDGTKTQLDSNFSKYSGEEAANAKSVFDANSAGDGPGRWVTINGRHVFVRDENVSNIRVIAADQDLESYLGEHRDEFLAAFANDLQPLRTAMEYALRGVPYGPDFSARLTMLKTELPGILKEINQAPKTAGMLSEIIANAVKHGLESRQGEQFGNADATGNWVTINGHHVFIKSGETRSADEVQRSGETGNKKWDFTNPNQIGQVTDYRTAPWKKEPGDFTKAAQAAGTYAKKQGVSMMVVAGNSYDYKTFSIIHATEDVHKVKGSGDQHNVALVHPDGKVIQVTAIRHRLETRQGSEFGNADAGGHWITIHGAHVFIKEGEQVPEGAKKSPIGRIWTVIARKDGSVSARKGPLGSDHKATIVRQDDKQLEVRLAGYTETHGARIGNSASYSAKTKIPPETIVIDISSSETPPHGQYTTYKGQEKTTE